MRQDTLIELCPLGALWAPEARQIDPSPAPETRLRALWTAQGVPDDKQDLLVAGITAKAQPGAKVGPFTIPGAKPARLCQQCGKPALTGRWFCSEKCKAKFQAVGERFAARLAKTTIKGEQALAGL